VDGPETVTSDNRPEDRGGGIGVRTADVTR